MADTIKGYAVVPDSGPNCPYAADGHGTEAANEGKGSATKWAKRKGGATSYDEAAKAKE
jgi:hypothetical protein